MIAKNPKRKPAARGKRAKPTIKPSIWDKIAARAAAIPDEDLARIPTDAARNLDHYLYGAPKRD